MNKRIVALGVSAAMALGAGTAVAGTDQDLSTNQGNVVDLVLIQDADVWGKSFQDSPVAIAKADASAKSGVFVGGKEVEDVDIDVDVEGGDAYAGAFNVNVGTQAVGQSADIDLTLENEANGGTKIAIDDVKIKIDIDD